MDKVLKAVQLLTLILISLVCLTYIWRQYYDYKSRQEAWAICYKWAYDEAKILSGKVAARIARVQFPDIDLISPKFHRA